MPKDYHRILRSRTRHARGERSAPSSKPSSRSQPPAPLKLSTTSKPLTTSENKQKDQQSPLNLAKKSFRLVRVAPGSKRNPIHCTVFHASLPKWKGKYVAVSYEWKEHTGSQSILVNGQPFNVTRNLLAFLKVIQSSQARHSLTFWIDGICIDQESSSEKNHQVKMMGDIYESAREVCCWLGPASGDSNWLFDRLNQHSTKRHRAGNISDIAGKEDYQWYQALHYFLKRSYWTRLWVVQEIVLASRAVLLCGSRELSWDDLIALVGDICAGTDQASSERHIYDRLINLQQTRGSSDNIQTLFCNHQAKLRSSKSDKIYRLLEIAQKRYGQFRDFEPRYHRPPIDAIIQILERANPCLNDPFHYMSSAMDALDIEISGLPQYFGECDPTLTLCLRHRSVITKLWHSQHRELSLGGSWEVIIGLADEHHEDSMTFRKFSMSAEPLVGDCLLNSMAWMEARMIIRFDNSLLPSKASIIGFATWFGPDESRAKILPIGEWQACRAWCARRPELTVTEYGPATKNLQISSPYLTGLVCLLSMLDRPLSPYWERNFEEILRVFQPSNFTWPTQP